MPSFLALSARFAEIPEPGKTMTPIGSSSFIQALRSQGIIPTVNKTTNPDGSLASARVNFMQNGSSVGMTFFRSMDGCQAQLEADIADGQVTDTNSLR
jgi:hypothetical protein